MYILRMAVENSLLSSLCSSVNWIKYLQIKGRGIGQNV